MNTSADKYELVLDDTKVVDGRTLYRIRALVAIAATLTTPAVAVGDMGGYVEGTKNLAKSGDAWVYGDAWVSGNARVSGDARVSGNAQVSGDARVSGNAWVSGDARVSGDALVSGSAQVHGHARVSGDAQVSGDALVSGNGLIFWASKVGTENGTLTVCNAKDNRLHVTRGCFSGAPEQFLAASEEIHDARTRHEYKLLIEVATSRIEAARKELAETEASE